MIPLSVGMGPRLAFQSLSALWSSVLKWSSFIPVSDHWYEDSAMQPLNVTGQLVALCKAHDDGKDSTLARVLEEVDIGGEHNYIQYVA